MSFLPILRSACRQLALTMPLIYLQMWVQEALSYFKGENYVPKRK